MIGKMLTMSVVALVSSCHAFKLLSIERGIEKPGLHRQLVTNVSFEVQSEEELYGADTPNLIFREIVTKDTYVYLEEWQLNPGLDFFPLVPIDIEKPASVSADHELLWRLRAQDCLVASSHVKSSFVNGKALEAGAKPSKYPAKIDCSVKLDYHLRYQPVRAGGDYVDVTIAGDLEVYLDKGGKTELNKFS